MSNYKKIPDELFDLIYYDTSSPSCLRWKVDRYAGNNYNIKNISAGDVAGSLHSTGYYVVSINSKRFKAHRIIYKIHNPTFDETLDIDHMDRNPINNTIDNLRAVSHKTNGRNCNKSSNNSSGVTGVGISDKGGGRYYYVAELKMIGQRKLSKSFSISKYGKAEAFKLACIARENFLKEQEDFTSHHGK